MHALRTRTHAPRDSFVLNARTVDIYSEQRSWSNKVDHVRVLVQHSLVRLALAVAVAVAVVAANLFSAVTTLVTIMVPKLAKKSASKI